MIRERKVKYYITIDNRDYEVDINSRSKNDVEVQINGISHQINIATVGSKISYLVDHIHYEAVVRNKTPHEYMVTVNGTDVRTIVETEIEKRFERQSGKKVVDKSIDVIKAPMPGLIVTIDVEVGQHIQPGDGLIIMEAMKMENELKASQEGIIKTIHVQKNDKVEINAPLITIDLDVS